MDDTTLVVIVALAMAVGVVGTVVPVLPGLMLVWAAALVYGLVGGFGAVGTAAFVVITALAAAGTLAGIVVPRRAATRGGAARQSMWLGSALGVVGFFVVPFVGVLVGGVLGVFLGEALRTRDSAAAWRSTLATLKGFGLAGLLQVAAALSMVVVWVAWVVAG
jgi:uncharacterized protein